MVKARNTLRRIEEKKGSEIWGRQRNRERERGEIVMMLMLMLMPKMMMKKKKTRILRGGGTRGIGHRNGFARLQSRSAS